MTDRGKIALLLAGGQVIFKNNQAGTEFSPLEKDELSACLSDSVRDGIYTVDWSCQPMYHYTLRMCGDLIQMAGAQIEEGAAGVVVTCGTQALAEAAYYADLVWHYPQPLIFTASINLAGTPGSETCLLLSQAVKAAGSQVCWGQGVLVCVQDRLYAGSEIHQMSNYNRSGFDALPCGPVAEFSEPGGTLVFLRSPRRGRVLNIATLPARNVEVVYSSLGGGDVMLHALLDGRIGELDGLVISAFGGGDVHPSWVPLLRKIMRGGLPLVLASRCPNGRVMPDANTFDGAAKHLLEMGLISARDLTPGQARIRLALGIGAELQDLRAYMMNE